MVLFMFLAFELVGETFNFDHIIEMKILRNTFEFYTVQNNSRFLRLCAKSSSACNHSNQSYSAVHRYGALSYAV